MNILGGNEHWVACDRVAATAKEGEENTVCETDGSEGRGRKGEVDRV